jgi:putative ABC transport system substrate-binding protein
MWCRTVGCIVMLTLSLLAVPLAAEAEQAGKVSRIAFLSTGSPEDSPTADAFRQELHALGYVEGQNILIEWRWGRGTTERFPDFAAEVVSRNVAVIVAANTAAGLAAQRATRTIPIVLAVSGDPVGDGLVASLARPGGNVTGLSVQLPDIAAKRLQLLREAVPNVSRIAVLVDTTAGGYRQAVSEAEGAARALGAQLQMQEVSRPSELSGAFTAFTQQGAGAVFIVGGTMLHANRAHLAEQAQRSRLPMMCGERETVLAGCLMSYYASLGDLFRRAAHFVDKILKGAKPGDLPVEQPTKFELVLNLKTAQALGITMPPTLLFQADEVIR